MLRRPDPWSIKQRRGYWYYKLRGESAYRSTGIAVANWKQTKPKAQRFASDAAGTGPKSADCETLGEFAAPYFLPDSCPWFARERGRGNMVQEYERAQHRSRLELHILPQFQRIRLEELSPVAIERWLYALPYSAQTKKHILRTFKVLLGDLHRERLISFAAEEVRAPVVHHSEREIPTDEEAATLFPADTAAFRERWRSHPRLGVFLALAYSSGMRTSELRALKWAAIHPDLRGLVVVETITRDDRAGAPKASSVRAIPLPAWTLDLLQALQDPREGLVFPGHVKGTHLTIGAANHALRAVCAEASIESWLTPHGLRHAYNTRMRAILAESQFAAFFDETRGFRATTKATDDVLRAFTGHKSASMTELYDHPELLRALAFFSEHFGAHVDAYWNFRDKEQKHG